MHTELDIVVASSNAGKIAELARTLAPLGVNLRPQQEFGVPPIAETGLTFVENALLKARAAARHTGLAAIADDSGLAVDALGGAPGIYSARYTDGGDAANNARLLAELSHVPDEARSARFHCVLVYLRHAEDPVPVIAHGMWEGSILHACVGEGGFGYDPLFHVASQGKSAAELDPATKNRISHRARASAALLEALERSGLQ